MLHQRNLEATCHLIAPRNLIWEALTQVAVAILGTTADRRVATTVGNQLPFKASRIFTNKFSYPRNTCGDSFIGGGVTKADVLSFVWHTWPKMDIR